MEDLQPLFDFVKRYREDIRSGGDVFGFAVRFMNIFNDSAEFEEMVESLGDSPPGRAFADILRFSEDARQFIGLLNAQEYEELVDNLVRSIDAFLAFETFQQGTRGLTKLKQMGKAGLPVPSDVESRVVGFLSPAGRAESVGAALSRAATSVGKPGVVGRSESPPPPPPGGAGPAAAGAGGPAGGKRRRKTRKGKSKKRRYSRRR